jgi:uncharacterized tellurite resistance protein B-like protein
MAPAATASYNRRMLKAIRQFFDSRIAGQQGDDSARGLQLATAALLLETVRADHSIDDAERSMVQRAVREKFALDEAAAGELMALAEQEVAQATDFYQFTSLVNRHFSVEQKNRVVELMWRVAYADDHLHAHERHLIRKIADLLHVTHVDYLAAQARARQPG